MSISLSWPLRGALFAVAALTMSTFTASAGASVPVELRVVDSAGAILAEQTQYTDSVALKTDPKAKCFGEGTGGSGDRVGIPGKTALGSVVDGQIADRDLKPVSVTDAFDFGLGVCGIGDAVSSQSGFWYLKQDHVVSMTGGDQTKVKRGDAILWYLDPDFSDAPPSELELVIPPRSDSSLPFEAQVFEYADDGTRSPAAGVTVSGAAEPTGADGTTQVTVESRNEEVQELEAARAGSISDAARICVRNQLELCPARPGDLVGGSTKDDKIEGSKGPDAIFAGRGDDTLDVRDGGTRPDEVNCGTGKDKVKANSQDEIARNCEKVRD
jgi:Ca2+-binding RTX toxin-like protein